MSTLLKFACIIFILLNAFKLNHCKAQEQHLTQLPKSDSSNNKENLRLIGNILTENLQKKVLSLARDGLVSGLRLYDHAIEVAAKRGILYPDDLTENCSKIVAQFFKQIAEDYFSGELPIDKWTLNLVDSMGKAPAGLFHFDFFWLGHFQQCLDIDAKNVPVGNGNETIDFVGEYCLTRMDIQTMNTSKTWNNEMYYLKYGLCLPDKCTNLDKYKLVKHYVGEEKEVIIRDEYCQTNQMRKMDITAIILTLIIAIIIAIPLNATAYDYWDLRKSTENDEKSNACAKLDRYSEKNIANQRYFYYLGKSFVGQVMQNGSLSITSFMFLSGLCVSYSLLKKMQNSKFRFNFLQIFLFRYLRTIPTYVFCIIFMAGPFAYLANGPIWPMTFHMANVCRTKWWQNILFINNYFDGVYKGCLPHTWYLAADLQVFLILPIIIIPMIKKPKIALFIIGALILIFAIVNAVIVGMTNWTLYFSKFTSGKDYSDSILKYFCMPWAHIITYLQGILAGYYLHHTKCQATYKPIFVATNWLLALAVTFAIVLMTFPFNLYVEMPSYVKFLHTMLSRPAWCLALTWIITACATGYGGIANSFLSSSIFQPFGRIGYSCYLVHLNIILILMMTTRETTYFNVASMARDTIMVLALTIPAGIITNFIVESPFGDLTNIFLLGSKNNSKRTPNGQIPDISKQKEENTVELAALKLSCENN